MINLLCVNDILNDFCSTQVFGFFYVCKSSSHRYFMEFQLMSESELPLDLVQMDIRENK